MNFADKVRVDVDMTSDVATLEAGISRVDSIGGTALPAVTTAEMYLHDHAKHDRRVLLVITDGRDNASTVTLQQIEQLSRQSETAVYAVGLFGNADSAEAKDGLHELDALTKRTGGVAYYPSSLTKLMPLRPISLIKSAASTRSPTRQRIRRSTAVTAASASRPVDERR